jgi:HD-like signal output (HDOD) protein
MNLSSPQIDLRQAISNLNVLPAMPVIAQKLLALAPDSEESERMLLMLIEQDPQLSAKIIGLANSALIGAARNITTVREAAMLMGIARVQSVSTAIAIMSLMHKAPVGRLILQDLWLHSFGIAFAMHGIARAMPGNIQPKDGQIFLAGLLHDIGYLALVFLDPIRSNQLHARLETEPDRPALEIEQSMLEICHDELGAELARHWNLPAELIAVLRYHHSPDAAESSAGQTLARMINIAEKLLPSFGISEYVDTRISDDEWKALGIDPLRAADIKEFVAEQAQEAMELASTLI